MTTLAVVPLEVTYPVMDTSLSGLKVPRNVLVSSIFSLQSYLYCSGFSSGEFLTRIFQRNSRETFQLGKLI